MTANTFIRCIMLAISAWLILAHLPNAMAEDFSDEGFCKMMEGLQQQGLPDVGKMVDQFTRNDGEAVLCGRKVIEFKKFLLVNSNEMREGWQERKARQWNNIYCEGVWLDAINHGWTVALSVITKDGERFWYKADCTPIAKP